jgi:hypothetical protein
MAWLTQQVRSALADQTGAFLSRRRGSANTQGVQLDERLVDLAAAEALAHDLPLQR